VKFEILKLKARNAGLVNLSVHFICKHACCNYSTRCLSGVPIHAKLRLN